jgi:hypothetical protein|tara:strand:+ start:1620 stop:1982 length:363 start_codon:yes stop_codon:yes gene_type:complete
LKAFVGIAFAMILVAGCVVSAPNPWDVHVRYVGGAMDIKEYRDDSVPGGLTEVYLAALSKRDFTQKVRYRVLWYSSSGQPLKSTLSGWRTKSVAARSILEIATISPSADAQDYRIEIEDL